MSSAATPRFPQTPAAQPSKKPSSGQPWSDAETAHLIAAYEEKWYSLRRGQLKAQQWDEVAASLAARCGHGFPIRTGTQCRHKMEKLRKRYRSECQAPQALPWIHFDQMDRMEHGPVPISVHAPGKAGQGSGYRASAGESDASEDEEDENEEEEEEDDDEDEGPAGVNGHRWGMNGGGFAEGRWGFPGGVSKKARVFQETNPARPEESELFSAVRRFEDGFLKLERRRIDMMREIKRDWMEMEERRAEMVLESERYLMDTISRAFHSAKKSNKPSGS